MSKILTFENDVQVGSFKFPDRKKPYLGIRKGSHIHCYGQFINESSADNFIDELALILETTGIKIIEGKNIDE